MEAIWLMIAGIAGATLKQIIDWIRGHPVDEATLSKMVTDAAGDLVANSHQQNEEYRKQVAELRNDMADLRRANDVCEARNDRLEAEMRVMARWGDEVTRTLSAQGVSVPPMPSWPTEETS